MTLEDRIKALYLFISEPEMHLHMLDGTRVFDRCTFWHVVDKLDRDNSDRLVLILWSRLKNKIPVSLINYFLHENGSYLRWQGIYYRMGLYEEIGFPYEEWEEMLYIATKEKMQIQATMTYDQCIFVNRWGNA